MNFIKKTVFYFYLFIFFRFVSDVSKLIPNEKFELYSKTYEKVEKEIINNFQISNDWATWCLEHYDCKSNNATNTTDKEH